MQVFVPHDDFQRSLACLDYRRLGKQRVECMQILAALRSLGVHESGPGLPKGWTRHPATLAWRGCESALAVYMTMCVSEWTARGYKNTMMTPYNQQTFLLNPGWPEGLVADGRDAPLPVWWGREDVHASHRAALLYKDPEHYGTLGWSEAPMLNYVWPSAEMEEEWI